MVIIEIYFDSRALRIDKWDVGCGRKKRVGNNSKVFGHSTWVLTFPFTRMGKTRQGAHDSRWEFRVGYNQFRHPREYSKLASGYMSLELRGEGGV